MSKTIFMGAALVATWLAGCSQVPVHELHKSVGTIGGGAPRSGDQPTTLIATDPVEFLLARADFLDHAGESLKAAATLERGVRIAPEDARLWLRLAQLRLASGSALLAESLAIKSISLAADDRDLLRRSWEVISDARAKAGDPGGSEVARQRAIALQ
ncbi:MAG TPA: tetratricopeptide repeat protein [Chromatiaceae bacterium]|nr:tetratricopeptide repeat protein [Chromatiaceae bacterium]HIN82670.1 tetratricopeptide repeat protein [Chromatiales bacterium]